VIISSSRIVYVDIERVFSSLDIVSESRLRMQELIEERREEVRSGETAVDSLKKRLDAQRETLSEEEADELIRMIDAHERSLREIMEKSREELLSREEELTLNIMGDIYEAVSELTEIEGYSVILEKESVLYSRDTVEDITERIIALINEKHK